MLRDTVWLIISPWATVVKGAIVAALGVAEEGEIITCDDCGSELEVTGKDSVQEAPQEEEDWGE